MFLFVFFPSMFFFGGNKGGIFDSIVSAELLFSAQNALVTG